MHFHFFVNFIHIVRRSFVCLLTVVSEITRIQKLKLNNVGQTFVITIGDYKSSSG